MTFLEYLMWSGVEIAVVIGIAYIGAAAVWKAWEMFK